MSATGRLTPKQREALASIRRVYGRSIRNIPGGRHVLWRLEDMDMVLCSFGKAYITPNGRAALETDPPARPDDPPAA